MNARRTFYCVKTAVGRFIKSWKVRITPPCVLDIIDGRVLEASFKLTEHDNGDHGYLKDRSSIGTDTR